MKRTILPTLLLLALLALPVCAGTGDQTPEFLNDVGKTLSELKAAHPDSECTVRLDGFPDSAAACLEESGAEYACYFFGAQSGNMETALSECESALRCAGFVTTAGTLFPAMEEEMSFEDFFSLIGVADYEYLSGEAVITGEGWLRFLFQGMEVMVNTNEAAPTGGQTFKDSKTLKRSAPASIIDTQLAAANMALAEAYLFG